VDAGTDAGIYSDIDGDVRYYRSGFDMGSDECAELPGELTQITLESPAVDANPYAAPVFRWMPDGGTNNVFIVDLTTWGNTQSYSSRIVNDSSWTMPDAIWNKISGGTYVFWSIRGANLDSAPLAVITSDETWWVIKP
jgi:hypothetical protein